MLPPAKETHHAAQDTTRSSSWMTRKPATATRASRDGREEKAKTTSLIPHF